MNQNNPGPTVPFRVPTAEEDEMDIVYIVGTFDTLSDWSNIESVHLTAEGAEAARKGRQMIYNDWTNKRYTVQVHEMRLND